MENKIGNNTREEYRLEWLTKKELNRLKKMVLGYGKFRKVSSRSGVHPNTFRNVIDRGGSGEPLTIQIIREHLLSGKK